MPLMVTLMIYSEYWMVAVSDIDKMIKELSNTELLQLFEMLRLKNTKFEKDLYDVLTLIRANKRARGRG